MSLFIFRKHRELYEECLAKKLRVLELEWLERDWADLKRRIAALEEENLQLRTAPPVLSAPSSPADWAKDFSEQILQEAPFPDGKIPDHLYLTPEVPV